MVKTALVVEDDNGMQAVVREALEAAGLQVLVEKDGDWAFKALQRRLPDVLVTDLLLPQIGGFELIEKLRALPGGEHVAVVVMSGIYKSARHKRQATEKLGAVACLDKPFALEELVVVVQQAVGEAPKKRRAADSGLPKAPKPQAHGSVRAEGMVDDPLADFDSRLDKSDGERAGQSLPAERTVRGNLKNKRFPEVLAQMYRWKATGALLVRRGRIKKIVYVKDGYPVFVKSNLMSECLGRVLVREKMISEDECERSLVIAKSPAGGGRQQGTVLIEMGALSPHNLVFALQLQLEQKLFDVFAWPDGDYQFSARIELPAQSVQLDMTLVTIVSEGVRRKFTDTQLQDLLEPFLDAFVGPHPEPGMRVEDLPLELDERALVDRIDGRRTLRDLVAHGGMPPRAARQLLYALIAAEIVLPSMRPARSGARGDERPSTPPAASSSSASMAALPPSPLATRTTPPPLPKKRESTAPLPLQAAVTTSPSLPPRRSAAGDPVLAPAALAEVVSVEELRARLVERARLWKRQNHFEALGVSQRAGVDELQRAYQALVRDLHPDRLRRTSDGALPADARALADQLHHQLTTAFETLSDERRRADYAARLTPGPRTAASDDITRLLKADTAFRKGEAALDAERLADAVVHFRDAAGLFPDEGEFQASLAWALYRQAPDDPVVQVDVIGRLQRATELAPRYDRGWLWFGRVLQRAGRPGEALKQFERALQCNPDSRDAQSELQLLAPAR
ncbi:MAG: response regulator [Deltaproteobacteria bacterium]|nr:response regulator [Deltaproteobacteria bacterium]